MGEWVELHRNEGQEEKEGEKRWFTIHFIVGAGWERNFVCVKVLKLTI